MKNIDIVQFKGDSLNKIKDIIAEERILHLDVNSEVSFDVIVTPENIREFVYGNLYTEGFIRARQDILEFHEKFKVNLISASVEIKDFSKRKRYLRKNYNIAWTECGSAPEIKRFTDQFKKIKSDMKIKATDVLNIFNKIKNKIDRFKQTGAFHYAFLFDKNIELVRFAYDIGRHNAVDKVVGDELLVSGKFDDKVLFITGRISSDIVFKSLRAEIPVIISRGAPLDNAVTIARKYNICLIGFLRGKRFNIYSNPGVIVS